MSEYKLTLEKRTETGKKLKNLRKKGLIPSVIFGGKEDILTASDYNATEKVLRAAGYHSPIDLNFDGKNHLAIAKNVTIDPVSRRIINVEFKAISARAAVEATTPIVLVNFEESEAHKNHLAFLQTLEEIDVKAKPSALPKEIAIDASKLATIEDKITVADIVLPEGVEFANKELDTETIIANMYDPAAEAAAREAEEAAAREAEEAAAESEPEDEAAAKDSDEEKAE